MLKEKARERALSVTVRPKEVNVMGSHAAYDSMAEAVCKAADASETLYAECRMRYPLPGDFIIPFGRNGRRSLNDFLSRKKIDPAFRSRVPVLAAGNEVIWAVGAGASEKARASDPPGRSPRS